LKKPTSTGQSYFENQARDNINWASSDLADMFEKEAEQEKQLLAKLAVTLPVE
jgi:hypothetical protein